MSYLDELFSVAGKTALVTGAATGIGRMAATALVKAGASVMIASRKGEDCIKVAAELNGLGTSGRAEGFAVDEQDDRSGQQADGRGDGQRQGQQILIGLSVQQCQLLRRLVGVARHDRVDGRPDGERH